MNLAELKLKLFRQIDGLASDKLEEAYGVLLNFINSKDDLEEWNYLTPEQQKGILDSIMLMDDGEGVSHEEIMKKYKDKYDA